MQQTKKIETVAPSRPPIIAVLGHVDHGKTSLLDYIRKSSVAAREHGGITQHIGAYQTAVASGSQQKSESTRLITFIDTPGHEAFEKMRSRGASTADIAILVVAAEDSVKPQTIESIRMIKEAQIPMIVAINKIDLESADIQKVKQDLAKAEVQVEGFGGDVPWVGVSAKTGKGVPELLDMILLLWDMQEKQSPIADFSGNVVETQVDKGKGMIASVIVKTGILRVGCVIFETDKEVGKVRGMIDGEGKQIKEAIPGQPVQVSGFYTLPTIGALLHDKPVQIIQKEQPKQNISHEPSIPDFLKPLDEVEQKLVILLKTDTAGSMEAIKASLPDKIDIVFSGYGDITEADILNARSNQAFIVGFNVSCKGTAQKLAETEKVIYRTYTIIYELLDELTDVVSGMKEVMTGEREVGSGTVLAQFPFNKQQVAGTKVLSGRFAKGDMVKIIRGDQEIARTRIKSLRQGKLEVTKVEEGQECGVLFEKIVAFQLEDGIISYIK